MFKMKGKCNQGYDGMAEMLQEKIQFWKESIRGRTIGNTMPISAAVGYACGSGSELEMGIKKANKMLYQNKREYHKNKAR